MAAVQGVHAAPPEQPAIVETARLVAAFEQICLDHVRDPQARAAAAQAAPWNMKPTPGEVGLFFGQSMKLHIVEADSRCALTARIDATASLESVATAAAALLPRDAAQPGSPDTLLWAANDPAGAKIGVGLKVSNQSGMNLATFNVQKLGQSQ
ncbi:hypothetical protein U1839_20345 [Sphingomonas sp. RT2P30]|uniref:hypothetical protein n=1 Tax=Parasphingomonas halimpatiens TaxID=3096162 RepID=UPI002FCA731C